VAIERRDGQDRRTREQALTSEERAARDVQEFQRAMEHFCRLARYPTCHDVLQVARSLGYRRVPTS
jgi:hypothetical protein